MKAENPIDSIFKVNQTKGFIVFINSKIPGEYKMVLKDVIVFVTLTIKAANTFSRTFDRFSNGFFSSPTRAARVIRSTGK